jgi:hypothetical protein
VIKKEAEKILKYKDLTTEIQHMWNVNTEVIPVTIGATGIISKSLRKYLNIPGKPDIKELQKTVTLGTAHILREVLMQKYKMFIMGHNIICTTYYDHRVSVT